jgi:hypothetical protein
MRVIACGLVIACLGVVAVGAPRFRALVPRAAQEGRASNTQECGACHAAIAERYRETAHFRTSAPAEAGVLGPAPAEVITSVPTTRFRIERRRDGVHQTATWVAADRVMTRSERVDLTVGSGRRGQSYLYWRNGLLYQLPLSYLVAAGRWVNSPGYVDGEVHFERLIPPRCLECHASSFRLHGAPGSVKYADDYELGLSCAVCHRASTADRRPRVESAHPAIPTVNPERLARQQQIDLCAVCHSGADRESRRPPFTFRPGDRLADHLGPPDGRDDMEPDAHGNQVALLARSQCFQRSPTMTCSTCHDVHATGRDLAELSARCVACHAPAASGRTDAATLPKTHSAFAPELGTCVDCHMPLRPSRLIRISEGDRVLAPSYRTHRIAVYPGAGRSPAGRDGGDHP